MSNGPLRAVHYIDQHTFAHSLTCSGNSSRSIATIFLLKTMCLLSYHIIFLQMSINSTFSGSIVSIRKSLFQTCGSSGSLGTPKNVPCFHCSGVEANQSDRLQISLVPPGPGNVLLLPLPICSRTSSTNTSLCNSSWSWSARKTVSAGGTSLSQSEQKCKGLLVLVCLCALGAPLTPQSPLILPGSLTGFLLRMCLKTFIILFFSVLYELLLKNICFGQSYSLNFLASGNYDLNFARGYSVFFASAEFRRIFMVELCCCKTRRKGEHSPVGISQGLQHTSECVTSCSQHGQNNLSCVGLIHQGTPAQRGISSSQAPIASAVTPAGARAGF